MAEQDQPTVIVVGASARAAVQSLARANLSGFAIDLFGDRDLRKLAPCTVCPFDAYPDAFPGLLSGLPPGPILYTGGLENHPLVVEKLSQSRKLWGNAAHVLERVRDPYELTRVLSVHDFHSPSVIATGHPAPTSGEWLRKPLRSSGGNGIRLAETAEAPSASHYFQERIVGESYSAQYLNDFFLGATQQLTGETWLHARPFAYCGNIGPVELPASTVAVLGRLGVVLSREMGLRGLWGLDYIIRDGQVYSLEVNPRYTAAIEVLELSQGFASLAGHRASFSGDFTGDYPGYLAMSGSIGHSMVGKAIYYSPHHLAFQDQGPWDALLQDPFDPWRVPTHADIPDPGTTFEAGQPVLTVMVSGSSGDQCLQRLQSSVRELDNLFAEPLS